MKKDTAPQKNPDMVTRVIDDETILMPVYKTSEDINCIYTLNQAASAVWELIDGKRTLSAIKDEILQRFDTTAEEMEQEMAALLKDLLEIKAVS